MKPRIFISVVVAVAALILGGLAIADSHTKNFRASLDGYHETSLSLSTNGTGSFRARLNHDWRPAHIRASVLGTGRGKCTIRARSPRTDGDHGRSDVLPLRWRRSSCVPGCPATVTGTVTAANVIGPAGQGVAPGEFQEAIDAMRDGSAYANVHTTMYPSGEVRGQINEEQF